MVSLMGLVSAAHACGGLFCDAVAPVVQEGEQIIFEIDRENATVEVNVQIRYAGPAEEFGWIVPVSGEPELFVSPQILFDLVNPATSPTFTITQIDEGKCQNSPIRFGCPFACAPADDIGISGVPPTTAAWVEVGPYDAAVIEARTLDALLGFLDDNGFATPPRFADAIEPYIADGNRFVAIRLRKELPDGSLAPLGIRYPGTRASIPIQLTAVAVAPDMPLEVYVFAEERAVPETYLHVRINDAAINWFARGFGYQDVIARAADEAGGQAFATDYFGPPPLDPLPLPPRDLEGLSAIEDPARWAEQAIERIGGPLDVGASWFVADLAGAPPDVDPREFVGCPTCFRAELRDGFDAAEATRIFDEQVLEPLHGVNRKLGRRFVTRMTSALSAEEMTVDPVFVLNPDMSDDLVSNVRMVTQTFECKPNRRRWKARSRFELEDGRVIRLRSVDEGGYDDLIEVHGAIAAKVIERTGPSGQPEVLVDFTDELFALAQASHDDVGRGCAGWRGCASVGPGSWVGLGWLVWLVGRRRRSSSR